MLRAELQTAFKLSVSFGSLYLSLSLSNELAVSHSAWLLPLSAGGYVFVQVCRREPRVYCKWGNSPLSSYFSRRIHSFSAWILLRDASYVCF